MVQDAELRTFIDKYKWLFTMVIKKSSLFSEMKYSEDFGFHWIAKFITKHKILGKLI